MSTHSPLLRWLPRLLAILYAGFLSLFAFDVFGTGSLGSQLVALLIHLLPVYVVVAVLVVAWRWPRAGGVLFLALALGFTLVFGWREPLVLAALAAPLVIVGVLFLLTGYGGRARAKVA